MSLAIEPANQRAYAQTDHRVRLAIVPEGHRADLQNCSHRAQSSHRATVAIELLKDGHRADLHTQLKKGNYTRPTDHWSWARR